MDDKLQRDAIDEEKEEMDEHEPRGQLVHAWA